MRSAPKSRSSAVGLVVAVFALPGCGGEPGQLTAGEWVNAADRICADGTVAAAEITPPPVTTKETIGDAKARIRVLETVRDGLGQLEAPDEVDDEALAAYLGELDTDLAVLDEVVDASRAGRPFLTIDVSASLAATSIGLAACVTFSDTLSLMS